ncbi:DoxX family protein [Leptospira congkakensis]|uniref:DoxX family protein n=1 Tax=Leptospira congkakensis TaxID=2484932 RepID=A0A4Z1AE31_9LEPT|nr:DoxX family protein [Leptospira congkakensis]TGL90832.1 DoxX family protein [Leptospira congkakensis]TGL91841.1 DoxX family protein [Leptospira congkakensis]TGL98893.1 DoxX family protein [Leptospira congkakensis]
MFDYLFSTSGDIIPLILRITAFVVIFPHGAQKLLGWFGGYGFKGTYGFFTGQLKFPGILAVLIILGESFGSVLLLVGFLTKFAAASIAIIMIGAAVLAHRQNGFFINWNGNQKGEGYEFHILAAGLLIALVVGGAGVYSVDFNLIGKF